MSSRQKRVAMLVEHRERALGQRVEQLNLARSLVEAARTRVDSEQERLRLATERRRELLQGALQAGDWAETQSWVEDTSRCYARARGELLQAEAKVRNAQNEAVAARNDLKRLQVLMDRLLASARRTEERAEQKATDEHAGRARRNAAARVKERSA